MDNNEQIDNSLLLKSHKLELNYNMKDKLKKYNNFFLSRKTMNDDILTSYIIDNNLIEYSCKKCSQGPLWNKKPLKLVLDRINNIVSDNKLENLRFLCPNCFSQLKKRQSIFTKLIKNKQDVCIDCFKKIKVKTVSFKNVKTKSMRCKECLEKSITLPL